MHHFCRRYVRYRWHCVYFIGHMLVQRKQLGISCNAADVEEVPVLFAGRQVGCKTKGSLSKDLYAFFKQVLAIRPSAHEAVSARKILL